MPRENKQHEKIVIVDDEEIIRRFLIRSLKTLGYTDVSEAGSAEEGFEIIQRTKPSLVISDIHMPGENGLELLKKVKSAQPDTGFVIMTASDDLGDAIASLHLGADRYLLKPMNMEELDHTIANSLEHRRLILENRAYQKNLEKKVEERTTELSKTLHELDQANHRIRTSYIETIYRLTITSEYRDEETGAHIKRIGHYSKVLAKELGLTEERVDEIFYGSPMHDLGKVGIPDTILRKQGSLTPEEFEIMKQHTTIGAKILRDSSSEYLNVAEVIAFAHHERWDGTGYPRALKGDAIPLEGSIVQLADVYDALRSKRPYKEPLDHETVCRIITEGDGRTQPGHFCPAVLDVFKKSAQEFERLFIENQ